MNAKFKVGEEIFYLESNVINKGTIKYIERTEVSGVKTCDPIITHVYLIEFQNITDRALELFEKFDIIREEVVYASEQELKDNIQSK